MQVRIMGELCKVVELKWEGPSLLVFIIGLMATEQKRCFEKKILPFILGDHIITLWPSIQPLQYQFSITAHFP